MKTLIKLIINISLLLGSGYFAKEILFNVEDVVTKRIKKGLKVFLKNLTNYIFLCSL